MKKDLKKQVLGVIIYCYHSTMYEYAISKTAFTLIRQVSF